MSRTGVQSGCQASRLSHLCRVFVYLFPVLLAGLPAFSEWAAADGLPRPREVGETSTRFGIFVPASAVSGRDAALIVTAVQDATQVDIIDDGADGDTDDMVTGLALNTGQSYIVYIKEGAVNDDGTGTNAKKDGDFFLIKATKPVLAVDLTVNTDWQHEFVPADNRTMTGTSFYLYRPAGLTNSLQQLDIFSYNDSTHIKILDITATAKTTSGMTTVVSDAQGTVVLDKFLNAGADLLDVNNVAFHPVAGRTYHIVSNKGVSAQFGAIARNDSSSRDGGGYVPGKAGYTADRTFYFLIPYQNESERELRLVSYAQPANVTVRAWNRTTAKWTTITTVALTPYGHKELIGYDLGAAGTNNYFFEVTSDATISVFEVNWFETGSYGTSDVATFISSEAGTGAGTYFLAYMGPPGNMANGASASHLVISTHAGAQVEAYDTDSYGEYVELYNNSRRTINLQGWTLRNAANWSLTLPAGLTVAPLQTFLLKYHARAVEVTANSYVYGTSFPKFKIGNGSDTLVLSDPTGTYSDTLQYGDTGWGSHGVYKSLERKNPNLPFTAANSQDSTAVHARVANASLGDYYGTPGVAQSVAGVGNGSLVINEVMTGRIYQKVTIPADLFYDFSISRAEWESLNNGDTPGTTPDPVNRPEKPYIVVEASAPVSVMDSNWNDNWMTWGTGTLQPDPAVNLAADYYQREAGQPVVFTSYVRNRFVPLNSPVTTLVVPSGLRYTPGSYTTPPQLTGVVPTEVQQANGSWLITWTHGKPLPPDDVYRFQISATVDPALATNMLLQTVTRVTGVDPTASTINYSSQDSAVVNVGPAERTTVRDVVIDEVLPYPNCGEEQIELHNRGTNALDISNWELANGAGFIYRFGPSTFIPNDGYIVVHMADGVSTDKDHYTGQGYAGAFNSTEDQTTLYSSSTHSVSTIVDFVQWASESLVNPTRDDIAVAAGQWVNDTFVPAPARGQSVGRDRSATDNNNAADWDNTGGIDASRPTLNALNVSIPGADITPPDPVQNFTGSATTGQLGAVCLTWQNPANGDLASVRILRNVQTYPQGLNDGVEVYRGMAGVVTDTGLRQGQPVFYTAFSVDDAGNVACPAPASAQARAIPPQRIRLAYEDLKGNGWVDWDSNDLVVAQDSAVTLAPGGAGVAQIEMRFEAAARGSAYDHRLYVGLQLNGSATAQIDRYDGQGHLLNTQQTTFQDAADLLVFDSTYTALPPNPGTFSANTMPGASRQPGYATHILVTLASPASNPPETAQVPPFDPWLEVKNTGQRMHLMQAGGVGNSQRVWDSGSPLYGRDLPLALSFSLDWAWPSETKAIWLAYPSYTSFVTSGMTANTDWYTRPDARYVWTPALAALSRGAGLSLSPSPEDRGGVTEGARRALSPMEQGTTAGLRTGWPQAVQGLAVASPVMADVDGDGKRELVATTQDGFVYVWRAGGNLVTGWPQQIAATTRSSPAVGDIDGDGQPEIVLGADDQRLYAWHGNGQGLVGFPVQIEGSIKSSPVLANVDGPAGAEIIFTTGANRVFVVKGDGSLAPGWPLTMNGVTEAFGNLILNSTPAVGDLDGDGQPDIAVGSTDGGVYAWHVDGTRVSALWPRHTRDWVYPSPVIADLNRDGYPDLVAASGDGNLYAWRGDGWPLAGFPVRLRSGMIASPAVVDVDQDGELEVILATLQGKVNVYRSDGSIQPGWPRLAAAAIYASPVVGDVDGDGDLEVIVGSNNGLIYAWHHNGLPVTDWPKITADWVVATPALGDMDGDGLVEMAAGSYDGHVYVWDTKGLAGSVVWPAFHGGATHAGNVPGDVAVQPVPPVWGTWLPTVDLEGSPANVESQGPGDAGQTPGGEGQ